MEPTITLDTIIENHPAFEAGDVVDAHFIVADLVGWLEQETEMWRGESPQELVQTTGNGEAPLFKATELFFTKLEADGLEYLDLCGEFPEYDPLLLPKEYIDGLGELATEMEYGYGQRWPNVGWLGNRGDIIHFSANRAAVAFAFEALVEAGLVDRSDVCNDCLDDLFDMVAMNCTGCQNDWDISPEYAAKLSAAA